MKKKLLSVLALLTFTVSALAGCGKDAAPTSATSTESTGSVKQEISTNIVSEPYTLDPAIGSDTTSFWLIDNLFEGLYTFDKEGKIVEGAAQKVDISPDGKTYTFTIRDAKWSNGDPVTAKDFEYSWKRVLDPKTGAINAFYLYYIKGAEAYNKGKGSLNDVKINAKDDKTLVVELNAPTAYFPKVMMNEVYFPVNPKVVQANKDWATDTKNFVTNGPYTLTSWEHDKQVTVDKSKTYWNQQDVSMETIHFNMVPEATTYYQMFKTGELDLIDNLPTDVIKQEKENPEFVLLPKYGTYLYTFNVTQKPFNNAKIRRAFALAIDRDTLTKKVTQAGEIPATAYVPEGIKLADGTDFRAKQSYLKFDPAEAKRLLAEGMKEEGWSELPSVTIKYNTAQNHKKVVEAIQEMFKVNLGVQVKLENQEWKTYIDTYKQSNFQLARMGWIGSYLDPISMLDYYLGDSPNNQSKWVNPKYDELMAKAKVEQNEEKRIELLHQAEDVFMEDLPVLPVYFYSQNYLASKKVKDIVYSPNENPNLRWAKKVAE